MGGWKRFYNDSNDVKIEFLLPYIIINKLLYYLTVFVYETIYLLLFFFLVCEINTLLDLLN